MNLDFSTSLSASTSPQKNLASSGQDIVTGRADFGPFMRQEGRSPRASQGAGIADRRPSSPRGSIRPAMNSAPYSIQSPFAANLDSRNMFSSWIDSVSRLFSILE